MRCKRLASTLAYECNEQVDDNHCSGYDGVVSDVTMLSRLSMLHSFLLIMLPCAQHSGY